MNNKINEFKRKLIIETAQKYFLLYGYAGVKIDKIAKELGIGVGTIYSMFGSKEGLFLSWTFSIIENAYEEIKAYCEIEKNPLLKCKYFINFKLGHYEKNKAVLRDYMQNNQLFLKNTARRKENPMKKVYNIIADVIKELIYQYNPKNESPKKYDYYLLAYLLDSIINGYIERFCEMDENINLTTKSDEVLEMFLNTIGVRELVNEK